MSSVNENKAAYLISKMVKKLFENETKPIVRFYLQV